MKIPSVMQGLIETEDGKVLELDSPRGAAWLESIGSFRYEPTGDGKPYTVRKEGKSGEYWYGCRKIAGKVRKKYIGKSSEVSVVKLEEIAEALEIPPLARTEKVAEVAEVAEVSQVAESRVTALELQVATLLKAVEALQEALPGKFESGDSLELPKVDSEVAERLQNELSNLKAENEELRSKLATEETRYDELGEEYEALDEKYEELDAKYDETVEWWKEEESKVAARDAVIAELRSELADLKQKSATASELPEAADLLNQLKGRRKKSGADLADINAILGLLTDENGSNLV